MKKRIIVFLICFASNISFAYTQSNAINLSLDQTEALPKENIFVHFNSSLFLAGESIYYKIYCLNEGANTLSALSKIAYLELVGENQNIVFKHKIALETGVGYGDFIIPVTVNSGNYKLIAYTQWMKNEGVEVFFSSDISIINPFQSSQETILIDKDADQPNNTNTLLSLNSDTNTLKSINSNLLDIKINKKTFQKRDKVMLTLKSKNDESLSGNYSISVKKIDALHGLTSKAPSSNAYVNHLVNRKQSFKKINHLPELRGELISGTLLRVSDDKPVANEQVVLSIPQIDFILRVSKTNQDGVFYFNINEDYDKQIAVLQVLGKDAKDFKIVLDEHIPMDYNNLDFEEFKISSDYKEDLEQRNIYNQIENGYFSLKPNRLKEIDTVQPFFGDYFSTFYLDDYTRFNKIQETFVEIVKDAFIKKDNSQKFNFYVNSLNPYEQLEKPAGVIVDGILLQDFDELLSYDSRRINRISIARTETNFILGTKTFGGFIVIETIDGKFFDELTKGNLTNVTLFKPQPKKAYYKKVYTSDDKLNRTPDYRQQLFWEPNINIIDQEIDFTFFTSDNTGNYEISIEGFTKNGTPVSIRDYIIVN
ncbi:hypothetical protein MWU58_07155 [Flavobacteriaceae bacterium S0825]|uniref:hypothetical protein n=1 Tax=Gaetbulibacter sp. S0825 TaxID=2720084 RepID=UPI001431CBD2|nr:hypothetical protein [Gaetbulibacter sp. S0825]MCK0109065.1 hypothetical protein [Flavobacteriaceae bacterium S0825]NIX64700.1 hypothetical protein [Gaetbulibacter sp. S0825]